MPFQVSMSGDDTFLLNGNVVSTLATKDPLKINFPNDIAVVEQGKDGNTVISENRRGYEGDAVLRVLLGAADDQAINALFLEQAANIAGTTLITGALYKVSGDGKGNIIKVVYQLQGGVILKIPAALISASGNTEEQIAEWTIRFGNCSQRLIQ